MREVKVEALVEREGLRVIVEGGVDLRARVPECVVPETRDDLLLVADADGTLRVCKQRGVVDEPVLCGLPWETDDVPLLATGSRSRLQTQGPQSSRNRPIHHR